MEKGKGIKKYFLKNNYNLVFSILACITFLFFIFSASKLDLKLSLLIQTTGLFSPTIWFLLFLSLIVSSILAYFEKYKWIALPVFIWLLIFTVQFRVVNIPQLIDSTTGDYTLGPDLDPYLYLRLAKEINSGSLPTLDCMRYAPICSNNYARSNLMPWVIFGVYKIISIFSSLSLTYAAAITSVIFFLISIIGFFLFTKTIFSFKIDKIKSSLIALIASIFYAVSPTMLHRTTGGIPEIESLGLASFWFAFLFFTLAWKSTDKKKWIIFGIIAAMFTEIMSFSWGGYRFIYMILSLTTFIIFFLEKDIKKNIIIFSSWIIPSIIIEIIKFQNIIGVITNVSDTGFSVGVFSLLILQTIFLKFKLEEKIKVKISNSLKILILAIIIGIFGLLIINPKSIISLFSTVTNGLLYPFGKARVSLTVAENSAPYLTEAISSFGYILWTFFFSIILLFYDAVKHFNKNDRIKLVLSFIFFISCIFFTRISPSSILNGDNFLSHLIYFTGFIVFITIIIRMDIKSYQNKEAFKKIGWSYPLLLSFSFWAIVSMRGAVRLFFIISPIIILIASVLPIKLYELKKKSKEDLSKLILTILLILTVIVFAYTLIQYSNSSTLQAKATVPGAYEKQWQNAMGWVRENTPEKSIFVHWWDYGYWIQTIGERPTVTDGGHFTSYWDHLIGRYVLTTQNPETAFSYMKTTNVSYLLIDSSDIGKYPAYSKIGSDAEGEDRFSWIPTMISNPSKIQETANSTIRIFEGTSMVDQDIIYELNGKEIFLPVNKAAIIGVVLETTNLGELIQPQAVFIYQGNQIGIPIKYVYSSGKLIEFEEGLEATISIIQRVYSGTQGYQVDNTGALMYLSPKVMNSLVSQVYLLDDVFGRYKGLDLVHSEESLYTKGTGLNEFIYFNGVQGPIKIWKVTPPEYIIAREEFLSTSGDYAEFDDLEFK